MASTTASASLLGQASRTHAAGRAKERAAKWTARVGGIRQHVLTVAALGCADTAGFMHSMVVGLVVTAASLLVLDFKIQG
jgi:hypothetical protein